LVPNIFARDVVYCLLLVLLLTIIAASSEVQAAPKPSATHLLTEYLENPLGIDVPQPWLSWQLGQDVRGARQSAYQIQVADSLEALKSGKANVWDGGKVFSNQTVNIPLPASGGLASGMRCYWRVKVWDADGAPSDFSAPAWFEMGLLNKEDWQGVWLTAPFAGNGYHSALESKADVAKWVQIDLGESKEFASIRLFPCRAHSWYADITPGFGFPVRYRLEASDEHEFKQPVLLVDKTDADSAAADAGEEPVTLSFDPVKARYVRLTVTKLYTQADGRKLFALGEIQILDAMSANLALNKPVQALDSFEERGWARSCLTDGSAANGFPQGAAPLLRFEFALDKSVKRARAYVAGAGYCELYLNGGKVGDRVLDPAFTTFSKRVLYSAYDVTNQVKQGRNAVGAILGKGWYGGPPCVIAQLNIEFKDGTRASITTNPDWKYDLGPIVDNSVIHGETYDARLEQPGWGTPGFDDSKWRPVLVADPPTERLSAQMMPPIRVVETIKPKKMRRLKDGSWAFDFGQNFSGWCRLKVSGPAGTEVVLKHAELQNRDGTLGLFTIRAAKATDRYILKGEGMETYEPRFTYHGFRYAQISGLPGRPALGTLTGCVVHTDLPRRAAFECSDPLINKIQSNCVWGYRTNWHSIPTDCPQREERQGWMGDAHAAAETGLYNFDMAAAFRNYVRNMQDEQGEDGRIPDTAPHTWGNNPGDPTWSGAYTFIPWDVYRHSGDTRILERHYEGFKRYLDNLQSRAKDYIISHLGYGDWVSVGGWTPLELMHTGSYYRSAWIVARCAEILGHSEDAKKYNQLCSKIAEAFNANFFHPETNNYAGGSQFSNALPLYLNIVPEDRRKAVVDNLVNDIMVKYKGHLSTGFPGTKYLMDVLCNEGHADVAYTILMQRSFPSWGYMIECGATTIWEYWELTGMMSQNHPALGSVSGWFYRMVAGIVPRADTPGYECFDIKPFVAGDLKEAKASLNTIRGLAASHWKRDERGISLNVTIPANTQASVWVPKVGLANIEVEEGSAVVWRSGKFIPGVAGIAGASDAGDWIRFEAGSGDYSFRLARP